MFGHFPTRGSATRLPRPAVGHNHVIGKRRRSTTLPIQHRSVGRVLTLINASDAYLLCETRLDGRWIPTDGVAGRGGGRRCASRNDLTGQRLMALCHGRSLRQDCRKTRMAATNCPVTPSRSPRVPTPKPTPVCSGLYTSRRPMAESRPLQARHLPRPG